jgi:hypothetical protein
MTLPSPKRNTVDSKHFPETSRRHSDLPTFEAPETNGLGAASWGAFQEPMSVLEGLDT